MICASLLATLSPPGTEGVVSERVAALVQRNIIIAVVCLAIGIALGGGI